MKLSRTIAPLSILGVAILLNLPSQGGAYSLLGTSNNAANNGFQVNQASFTDAASNNNVTPDVNFPGATGAAMALWKAAVEWNSELRGGNGNGDPLQPGGLGSGNSNYDFHYHGTCTSTGGNLSAVVSGTGFLGSGVFAVTQIGNNGWKMSFDDSQWNWVDGPGNETSGGSPDIQGIGCHEFGHALGLGHSSVSGTTMFATTTPGGSPGQRSVEADDVAGIQAIYGVKSSTKPIITGLSGATYIGGLLTITGSNFNASTNEVWFTRNTGGTVNSTPMTVVKATATVNSTTSVSVVIPSGVAAGDVVVFKGGSSTTHSNKSAPFPFPLTAPPSHPIVSNLTPASLPTMGVPTPQLTIDGLNFATATSVSVGARTYTAGQFTIVNDTQIKVNFMPPPLDIGSVNVTVTNPQGTSPATSQVNLTLPVSTILVANPFNPPSGGQSVLYMGAPTPGEVPLIAFSGCFSPASLPPYVTFSIGGCGDLDFIPEIPPAFGANGVSQYTITIPSWFHGIFFLQFCRIDLVNPTFPLTVSNIQLMNVP